MPMSTPTEFTLWLNGAADVMGDAPTPEQWALVKEKVAEAMGFLASQRFLEKADEAVRQDKYRKEAEIKAKMDAEYMREQMKAKMAFDPNTHRFVGAPLLGLYNPNDQAVSLAGGAAMLVGGVNNPNKPKSK